MTQDITAITDRTKLLEKSVTLCLDGSLVAKYERLEARLRDAGPAVSLADDGSREVIAEQMQALRQQMLDSNQEFLLRCLPRLPRSQLRARMPRKAEGQDEDEAAEQYHGWVCELVAASCVDPAMTAEQADLLCDRLSEAQWGALAGAAWVVNFERQDIPFSVAASVLSRSSGEKSRPPEQSEPPAPSSLAESSSPEPFSSETPTEPSPAG